VKLSGLIIAQFSAKTMHNEALNTICGTDGWQVVCPYLLDRFVAFFRAVVFASFLCP